MFSSLVSSFRSSVSQKQEKTVQFKPYFNRRDFQNLYYITKNTYFTKNSSLDDDEIEGPKTLELEGLKSIANSDRPQMKLLCAKACFVEADYSACIKLLQKVNVINSKILYERTALLIQAMYLQNPQKSQRIKQVWSQYKNLKEENSTKFILKKIQWYELKEMKDIALSHQSIIEKCATMNKLQFKHEILDRKFQKVFQGMPSYLISKFWFIRFSNFIMEESEKPPGPITNFQLLNHLFEYQFYSKTEQPDIYRDRILFPLSEQIDYLIVNKKFWNLLQNFFGGIPIMRAHIKNPNYRVIDGGDTVRRIFVSLDKKREEQVFQIQTGTLWEFSFLPILSKKYGPGQLKVCKNGEFYLQNKGKIYGVNHRYKYITFEMEKIAFNSQEERTTKLYLISEYDMQKYDPESSKTYGAMGLTVQPAKTSYFNSILQILSQTYLFSSYFLQNKYFSDLDLSRNNTEGLFGEIACGLADIIKSLWFRNPEKSFSINAEKFKDLIFENYLKGKQIFADDQMCLVYIEKKADLARKKKTRIQKFMEFRNPPKQQKILERDPAILLKILLKALASDFSDAFPDYKPENTLRTKNKFNEQEIWKLYQTMRQFYEKFNHSMIYKLFGGYLSTIFQCKYCFYKKLKLEPYRVFDLNMPLDNPKQVLYYVPSTTIGEQARKVQFSTHGIQNLKELIEIVKRQLQIDPNETIMPLMVDRDFDLIREEISTQLGIKDLFQNLHILKDSLFLYSVFPTAENEVQALIQYRYKGFQSNQNLADGFPRLLPIDKSLLTPQRYDDLVNFIVDTIPIAIYQAPRKPYISKVVVHKMTKQKKSSKFSKIYDVEITVQTKNPVKNYRYIPIKGTLGTREAAVTLTLEQCFQNYRKQFLVNMEKYMFCPVCDKNRNINTRGTLYDVGDIFVVRLNRFVKKEKITTMITYPLENFDVHRYVSTKQLTRKVYDQIQDPKEKKAMEEVLKAQEQKPQHYYNLIGVVVHRGVTIQQGEFFTYCKALDGKWYEFKNEIVKPIDEESVNDFNAYMLIYQKDLENKVQNRSEILSEVESLSDRINYLRKDRSEDKSSISRQVLIM